MIDIYLTRGKHRAESMTDMVFRAVYKKTAPALIRNDRGKPYFKDKTKGHLSLSHSGDYTVLALSDAPVGIDIQRFCLKGNPLTMAKRFFAPEEARKIEETAPEQRTRFFLDLWAKKEAAVKATGLGFEMMPSSFSVLDNQLTLEGLSLSFIRVPVPAGYTAWLAASKDNLRVGAPVFIG